MQYLLDFGTGKFITRIYVARVVQTTLNTRHPMK